ncbi:hypothetical protein Scep_018203 [Stephania cephalantha]|uniref:Uncharacterized protein n=1 Tax=Stephania cephalantha TaxID=152367 RepID=A0AAP0IRJ6_9MAGN
MAEPHDRGGDGRGASPAIGSTGVGVESHPNPSPDLKTNKKKKKKSFFLPPDQTSRSGGRRCTRAHRARVHPLLGRAQNGPGSAHGPSLDLFWPRPGRVRPVWVDPTQTVKKEKMGEK